MLVDSRQEAVRVIKAMPKWTPGKVKGEPVRVSYMMPLNFKLWDGEEHNGSLANTKYEGLNTGTKDGVTYTMQMTMEFESNTTGYFVMTLEGSNIDYDGIYARNENGSVIHPEEYSHDGTVRFRFESGTLNIFIPDTEGGVVQAVLSK